MTEINLEIALPIAAFVISEILGALPISSNGIIQAVVIGIQAALKKVSSKQTANLSGSLPANQFSGP